jgi:protein-disulfide isomerase
MMTQKQTVVFAVVSILLLVGVFLFWGLYELRGVISLNELTGGGNTNGVTDLTNSGSDALITSAEDIYKNLITADDPIRGDKNAELTILEFGDFECPYSKQIYPDLITLLGEYQGRVNLVWKDFPNPVHTNARGAAVAAKCAGRQEKFWEYHDYLFENQESLSREVYNKIALELNLDLGKFNLCVDNQETIEQVGQGLTDGQKMGVDATPYLFVGKMKIDQVVSLETLRGVVQEELGK